jgi:hypothetical protein
MIRGRPRRSAPYDCVGAFDAVDACESILTHGGYGHRPGRSRVGLLPRESQPTLACSRGQSRSVAFGLKPNNAVSSLTDPHRCAFLIKPGGEGPRAWESGGKTDTLSFLNRAAPSRVGRNPLQLAPGSTIAAGPVPLCIPPYRAIVTPGGQEADRLRVKGERCRARCRTPAVCRYGQHRGVSVGSRHRGGTMKSREARR